MHKRPLISLKAGKSAPTPAKPGTRATTPYHAAKTQAPVGKARPPAAPAPSAQTTTDPREQLLASFKPDLPQESLAYCLLGAANATTLVQAGTALPEALAKSFALTGASREARGAMQDIAYRSMRQLARSQLLIGMLTNKMPAPPLLYGLLCTALALLLSDEDDQPLPYEEFTVVDQAVTLTGIHPGIAHGKGMMNAVLRRFLREKQELMAKVMQQQSGQYNYPQWWIDACKTAYPQNWQQILLAGNHNPPLTLRVNRRLSTAQEYLQKLQAAEMPARQVGPWAVRLDKAVPVQQIPGFEQGLVSVQDAGAQLAAPLLDVRDGMRVLDACAAPGGKTCHLLEMADLELVAIDSDAKRLQRVEENLQRLNLSASLKAFDAQSKVWWDGKLFDRILVDVPCTASGIVRRHPDIRWLRRRSDTLALANLATQILDNVWQMLAPGGKLLLVTCSIWPQESEAQAASFALRNNARRLDAPGQLFPTGTADQRQTADDKLTDNLVTSDHDGLFYALFEKSAA